MPARSASADFGIPKDISIFFWLPALPKDEIPSGDETDRLHRWGYRLYREMFNARQMLGLE